MTTPENPDSLVSERSPLKIQFDYACPKCGMHTRSETPDLVSCTVSARGTRRIGGI